MASPKTKLKDNSKKKPYEREQHNAAKRTGQPKQRWVPTGAIGGRWEKVNA